MSELIKRVAEYLNLRDENVMPGEASDDERLESAAAIIEMIKYPTDLMTYVGQGLRYDSANSIGSIYQAMVDADLTATLPRPPSHS